MLSVWAWRDRFALVTSTLPVNAPFPLSTLNGYSSPVSLRVCAACSLGRAVEGELQRGPRRECRVGGTAVLPQQKHYYGTARYAAQPSRPAAQRLEVTDSHPRRVDDTAVDIKPLVLLLPASAASGRKFTTCSPRLGAPVSPAPRVVLHVLYYSPPSHFCCHSSARMPDLVSEVDSERRAPRAPAGPGPGLALVRARALPGPAVARS